MPSRFLRSFSRKVMSGMIRSMPGRCSSSPNETPRSTASQLRWLAVAEPVDRQVHADLADAAERRECQFVRTAPSGRLRQRRPRPKNTRPPRSASRCPVRRPQHQPAGVDRWSRTCRSIVAFAELHRDSAADAGGTGQPLRADRRKARARRPTCARLPPMRPKRREQSAAATLRRHAAVSDRSPG